MASIVFLVTMLLSFLSVSSCMCIMTYVICCKQALGNTPRGVPIVVLIENPDDTKSIGVKV